MGLFSKTEDAPANGAAAPVPASTAKSLEGAASEVGAKHGRGGARPGAGRKPSDGKGLGKAPTGTTPETPAPPSEADLEFVKTIAENALEILDRIETNVILGTINSIGDKYLSEKADAFIKQREIGDADKRVVTNACASLALKYPGISKYAPEGALVIWASVHGLAFMDVMKTLKLAAVASRKMKGTPDAGQPPPHQDSNPG